MTISDSRKQKSCIALLMNTCSSYELGITRGIAAFLEREGIVLKILLRGEYQSTTPFLYEEALRDIITDGSVKALIIITGALIFHYKERESSSNPLKRLIDRFSSIPVISVGHPVDGVPGIVLDNRLGIRELINHLIEEHGCRNPLFIKGEIGIYDAEERYSAYRELLQEKGIPLKEELVLEGDFYNPGSIKEKLKECIDRGRSFDAIIASNDDQAMESLTLLKEAGLRVPQDVLITGFNNFLGDVYWAPPITTIHQPLYEMGYTAAQQLYRLINGETVPFKTELAPRLIKRYSCGCLGSDELSLPEEMGREEALTETDSRSDYKEMAIRQLYPVNTFTQLKEGLQALSEGIGLRSCYFVLTDSGLPGAGKESRAYDILKERENTLGLVEKALVTPLFNREGCFGHLVLGMEGEDLTFFEIISSIIASVISRILLFSKLQKYSLELEEKVLERSFQLEEANTEKTNFFINMAHETKTPLTLIQNYLEKYIQENGLNDDLKIIRRNVDTLLRNMVNFLDAEKLAQGQFFYNHDQVIHFSGLLVDKLKLFREIAERKGIGLESFIEENLYIRSDPYAIDRVINNLVDNAIKYNRQGGRVIVALKREGDWVLLRVEDTGIGMTPEQLESIFMPYHQLSGKKRNIQGIGMGLFITKRILDSIDAMPEIYSQPGIGTVFTVSFKSETHNVSGGEEYLPSGPIDSVPVIELLADYYHPEGTYSILLVDDNREMLHFLQSMLKETYTVFLATGGDEALEKLKSVPSPDLIISDIMMDGIDGHELFVALQKNSQFSDIPFIFLTAKSTVPDKLEGLSAGAIDYIYKPFLVEEMKAKIHSVIENRWTLKRGLLSKMKEKVVSMVDHLETESRSVEEVLIPEDLCREYHITVREQEVLKQVLKGLYNKEIATGLNISLKTVEYHLYNIYQKIQVQNRIELTNFILKYGK